MTAWLYSVKRFRIPGLILRCLCTDDSLVRFTSVFIERHWHANCETETRQKREISTWTVYHNVIDSDATVLKTSLKHHSPYVQEEAIWKRTEPFYLRRISVFNLRTISFFEVKCAIYVPLALPKGINNDWTLQLSTIGWTNRTNNLLWLRSIFWLILTLT